MASNISGRVSVSEKEFKDFHSIDRILFTRLLVSLGREANEAMQVMAYLIWLEKVSRDLRIVSKLLTASDSLLLDLVNEVVLSLICIETDQFPHHSNPIKDLPLTRSLTHTTLSVPYLLQNRVAIIGAITKIINDVCIRAFSDIVQRVESEKAVIQGSLSNPMVQPLYYDSTDHHLLLLPQRQQQQQHRTTSVANWCGHHGSSMFNGNVPPDERTIFLTFSNGYPISDCEVRDYFSRFSLLSLSLPPFLVFFLGKSRFILSSITCTLCIIGVIYVFIS